MSQTPELIIDVKHKTYILRGAWSTLHLDTLSQQLTPFTPEQTIIEAIDASGLCALDSAGALLLLRIYRALQTLYPNAKMIGLTEDQQQLIQLVQEKQCKDLEAVKKPKTQSMLYRLGEETVNKLKQIDGLILLIGDLVDKLLSSLGQWKKLEWPGVISNISSTGIQALPILALLSFLIGVVLAYQMGVQLETYGANVFIAYLSGMAIFREFAPLITAIIVAGRTSSAFTAQIGSMKINEEIDALSTMGLSPTELLVIPKVLGLLLVFPLIIFWSDIFSLLGAMMMSKLMLNVSYYDFLMRIQQTVGLKQLMLGLYKAPAFAILIALVGCHQGFCVQSSADSVGKQTTKSVVQALFLIIITDATYSVIYSWLNL